MKNNKLIWVVIGIAVAIILFRECEHRSDKKAWKDSTNSLADFLEGEKGSFFAGMDSILVQKEKTVAQNEVLSIDDIEALADQYPELKDISAIIKTELHTMIQDNLGYIHDTVWLSQNTDDFIPRDSVIKYFVPKGTRATKESVWYDIYLTMNDSLQMDSLKVRDKIDAILAWKKPDKKFKWLRKREPIVSIKSYNPYTDIGHVNNLVVKDERSKFVKVMTSKPMMVLYGGLAGYGIGRLQK
jgi:hypothetical protein